MMMIGGVRQYESAGNEQICIGKGALGRSFTCDWEGTGKVLVVEACQEWETGKAVRQELGGGRTSSLVMGGSGNMELG